MRKIIAFLGILAAFAVLSQAQVATAPYQNPRVQFLDDNGVVASGFKLCTYSAGTTTPKATYSDQGVTPNANPIILDSAGRATIYFASGAYKLVLLTAGTDATCSTGSTVWSQDNVTSASFSSPLQNVTIDTAAGNVIKINGNTLAASAGSATVTIPNATDTLVNLSSNQTLYNKTLDGTVGGTPTFKTVSGLRFASQYTGADLGAKLNNACVGGGTVYVSPGTFATAATIPSGCDVIALPGTYGCGAGITLQGGSSFVAQLRGLPGQGGAIFTPVAATDCFTIAAGAVSGRLEVGFNGQTRGVHAGAAVRVAAGTSLSYANRWKIDVSAIQWDGPVIKADDYFQDNEIWLNSSDSGDAASTERVLYLGAHAASNTIHIRQIDTPYYTAVEDASVVGQNPNKFLAPKVDANNAGGTPSGVTMWKISGGATGTQIIGGDTRCDATASGTKCIVISGNSTDTQFVGGAIWRGEAANGTGLEICDGCTATRLVGTQIKGFTTGISDLNASANVDVFSAVRFATNTGDYSFTAFQPITGITTAGSSIAQSFTYSIGDSIIGARPGDNDLYLRTKASTTGIIRLCDNGETKCATVDGATGNVATPALVLNGGTALVGQSGSGTSIVTTTSPTIATPTLTSPVLNTGISGSAISASSAGKAICWKTTTTLGYCSTAPGAGGDCTCN